MATIFRRRKPNGGLYAKWYFSYSDSFGRRKVKAGLPINIDKDGKDTQQLANKFEFEGLEIRKGFRVAPTFVELNSSKLVKDIISEYLTWGNTQGGRNGNSWNKAHASNIKRSLMFWIKELNLSVMADLKNILPGVEQALHQLLAKGLAGKTVNEYASALKGFINWSIKREYLNRNSLSALSKVNQKPSYVRRAMALEEIHKLLRAAPKHRALLYEVAFCTGLRKNELKNLTPLNLDKVNIGIVLDKEWTKNRKCGFCPIPELLFARLCEYSESEDALYHYHKYYRRSNCTSKIPENPLLFVPAHINEIIIEDLEKAGIERYNHHGKIDFHACRTAYINLVIASGTDAKTAQSAARHSSFDMTMNVYGRTNYSALKQVNQTVGDMVLLPEIDSKIAGNCDKNATQTHQNQVISLELTSYNSSFAGSSPVSVAKHTKPLSGKLNPDSGFLLPETENNKELTETGTERTGSTSTNTGSGTSETGTTNPTHDLRQIRDTKKR